MWREQLRFLKYKMGKHPMRKVISRVLLVAVILTVSSMTADTLWATGPEQEEEISANSEMSRARIAVTSEEVEREESEQEEALETMALEDTSWSLRLVSAAYPISEEIALTLVEVEEGYQVDVRIATDLMDMLSEARSLGLSPVICSAYRTRDTQEMLYQNEIDENLQLGMTQEEAVDAASMWVAMPGSSEHEIGLAVDLISLDYPILEKEQEQTKEQQWLMANAHRFGFILRYPADKTQITGIGYEPWHYRYVGKEAAQEIYERGCTLEEYLGLVE
jgi:D-alanyl-D-alanine carboxypeptidase